MNIKTPLKRFLSKLKNLLLPQVAIAGMEIKDVALRIARLQEGEFKKSAIVLEPGIIEAGKVKDKKQLTVYLKKLHDQFAKPKEVVPVIAILPSENFYTQVFSAPPLSQSGLEEAAALNLKSISPIDINAAYADWQRLGSREKEGKIELLGAFVNRLVVDEYVEVLEKAGFSAVAVEFPALAIARTIKELAAGIDPEKPQVVLNVASDGIDFMMLKSGNLYFNYFVPWKNVLEENRLSREILFSDFKETIIRELQKVTTFYRSHWEGKLNKLILITQALGDEISDFIKKNFQFEVTELKLREWGGGLQTSWFGVLGSALRGTMPRSKDNLISLMAVGTEKGYVQSEIKYFVKLWCNVIFAALGFLILTFIFVDSFLVRLSGQLEKKLQIITKVPESAEVARLQEQARSFNQLVNKAFIAKSQSPDWSPFFLKISVLAKKDIVFTRIFIDQSTALINAKTSSELDAINFKNALVREGFKNVSLPLSDIVTNPDGSVSFAITFRLGD
jgi:hypothetical protein